jgi:methionyl-tRNA formyltransferase
VRLVFIGSSAFGLRCFESALTIAEVEVVGLVTGSKQFAISYAPTGVTNVLHADFTPAAHAHNIPVARLTASMSHPELYERVASWRPDAFLVAGWYHMIPRRWRDLAPAFGLHASLLPDYSGGAPLVWAMIHGESQTGITLFMMDDGVDSGPIVGQLAEPIRTDDTIATLYGRIEERGLELLAQALPRLASGCLVPTPQPMIGRRVMPQRSPSDGWIDWTKDAAFIDRWVRAQTRPYPGAFTDLDNERFIIWRASVAGAVPGTTIECPGRVSRVGPDRYQVKCGQGSLELHEVTHGTTTFGPQALRRLLGGGGQHLGRTDSCLRNSKPC